MLLTGDKVLVTSRGMDRYGWVERVTNTGLIVRLFEGGSLFVGTARKYRRGDCINYGLFAVRKATGR